MSRGSSRFGHREVISLSPGWLHLYTATRALLGRFGRERSTPLAEE
jgi:hypothetical protein